jgi:hypothetical protein
MILGISEGASGGSGILIGGESNTSPHFPKTEANNLEAAKDRLGVNTVAWIDVISKSMMVGIFKCLRN